MQPPEFRGWVAQSGRWRRFFPGQALYHAGDAPDGLYGLGHGTLELNFPLDGVEPVAIHRAEPGFWVGESALLANEERMVSVFSATESLVFHLPSAAISRRLRERPECWHAFYQQSHINLGHAVRLLAGALVLTPRARFARLLLRLSDSAGAVVGSQEELGKLAGIRNTTTKRIVSSLVAEGAIESGYGKLVVIDRELLQAISNEE
jgi:CRP-like cAMP-binding protein